MHIPPADPHQYTVPLLSADGYVNPLPQRICNVSALSASNEVVYPTLKTVNYKGNHDAERPSTVSGKPKTSALKERHYCEEVSAPHAKNLRIVNFESDCSPRCNESESSCSFNVQKGQEKHAARTERNTGNTHQRHSLRRVTELVPATIRRSLQRFPTFVARPLIPTYGEKTIGQWGSFIYLVNQIFGAGILALPYVIKVSGWLPCFFANLLVCAVAMFGTLMIMRSMTMIHGNQNFERRVEYIPTVEYFLGRRFRFWTELCFYLSIQSLNVVSIAVVSQSIDHLLLWCWGRTFGLTIKPWPWSMAFRRFSSQQDVDNIYSSREGGLIFGITLGYLVNALLCIPLSCQNMDENMKIQCASFAFLITSILEISVSAAYRIFPFTFSPSYFFGVVKSTSTLTGGLLASPDSAFSFKPRRSLYASTQNLSRPLAEQQLKNYAVYNPVTAGNPTAYQMRLPPVAAARLPRTLGQYQYGQLLSTFIASYSYVNVIPSWANEMTPGVKVNLAVWSSSAFSCVVYYVFGFILAYAYPNVHTDNILQELLSDDASTGFLTKCSIYVFNLFTVLPGILVYSITTRYNLINSNVASAGKSFLLGCVCPFLFAWLLANDAYFSAVLQWSSLIFSLAVNFVIPSVVYIKACGTQRLASRNPTRHYRTFHSYANRTRQGVQSIMGDISAKLRDYLQSLPSNEIDPDLRELLDQPTPLLSRKSSLASLSNSTHTTGRRPSSPPFSAALETSLASMSPNFDRPFDASHLRSGDGNHSEASWPSVLKVDASLKLSKTPNGALPQEKAQFIFPSASVGVQTRFASPPRPHGRLATTPVSSTSTFKVFSSESLSVQTTNSDGHHVLRNLEKPAPRCASDSPRHSAVSASTLNQPPYLPKRSIPTFCTVQPPTTRRPSSVSDSNRRSSSSVNVSSSAERREGVAPEHTAPATRTLSLATQPLSLKAALAAAEPAASSSSSPQQPLDLPDRTFSDLLSYTHISRLISGSTPSHLASQTARHRFKRPKQVHFATSPDSSVPHVRSLPTEVSSPLSLPAVPVLTADDDRGTRELWKSLVKGTTERCSTGSRETRYPLTSLRDIIMRQSSRTLLRSYSLPSGRSLAASNSKRPSCDSSSMKRGRSLQPTLRNCISLDLDANRAANVYRAINVFRSTLESTKNAEKISRKKPAKFAHRFFRDDSLSEHSLVVPVKPGAPSIMITPTAESDSPLSVKDLTLNPILRLASIDYAASAGSSPPHRPMLSASSDTDVSLSSTIPFRRSDKDFSAPVLGAGIASEPWPDRRDSQPRSLPAHLDIFLRDYTPSSRASHRSVVHRLPTTLYLETSGGSALPQTTTESSGVFASEQLVAEDESSYTTTSRKYQTLEGAESNAASFRSGKHTPLSRAAALLHRTPSKSFIGFTVSQDGTTTRKDVSAPSDTSLYIPIRHRSLRSIPPKPTFLAPPPVALNELPIDPPVDIMVPPVPGAEDAYECDEEPSTGDLKPIRIHVFPRGPLRTYHLTTTRVLMGLLVGFCILSAGSQIIVDFLDSWGVLHVPRDDSSFAY